MKKAVSGCAFELSYSCYDLSSLKSSSLSSFSFLATPSCPFYFTLRAFGGFYLSNEPLILFFVSLLHSFWMEGNICHTVKPVFAFSERVSVFLDCSGTKWCKVFTPRFWLALVAEVDAGVRVVWHSGPGRCVVLPALSICSTVGGLHLT